MRRCVSRAACVLLVLSAAAAARAQTVDEIVAKNMQAKGGDKWKAVNTVKTTGKVTMQGMELPLTVYAKRPNYNRQEIMLQDKRLVQAFDGTTGWLINPMMGSETPQEVPQAISDLMKNNDFEGALVNYKAKGHTVELVGKAKVNTSEAYHLKVTMKTGHVQHYYLDANTGIELKTSTEVDFGSGRKQAVETEMSNYQSVNGVMVPHAVTQTIDGKTMLQMTFDKVEFNTPIDDALFKMPNK
jgi:outer membrane lipoprotein-sorting protein